MQKLIGRYRPYYFFPSPTTNVFPYVTRQLISRYCKMKCFSSIIWHLDATGLYPHLPPYSWSTDVHNPTVLLLGSDLPASGSPAPTNDNNTDKYAAVPFFAPLSIVAHHSLYLGFKLMLSQIVSNIPNYPRVCITCCLERRLSSGIEEYLHRLVDIWCCLKGLPGLLYGMPVTHQRRKISLFFQQEFHCFVKEDMSITWGWTRSLNCQSKFLCWTAVLLDSDQSS